MRGFSIVSLNWENITFVTAGTIIESLNDRKFMAGMRAPDSRKIT